MNRVVCSGVGVGLVVSVCAGFATAGDPWADAVVSFDAGTNAASGFDDPTTVLGSPERITGEALGFDGVVSPFNPAFGMDELVSIGSGGHITVRFDEAITNDSGNPFGVDFIVFGNAGFIETDFPNGSVGSDPGIFGVGGEATVEVSADGVSWATAAVTRLDLMPTLGYTDAGPFDPAPGSVETDFTKAVDPSLTLADLAGLGFAELLALYDGSGGGIGIDLEGTGLEAVSYVRLSNFSGSAFEVDAIVDASVPTPGGLAAIGFGLVGMGRRRRMA